MQRLEPGECKRIRPLFGGLRYNEVVDSVLDGNTPAWAYADDLRQSRTAWMRQRMDAMLLAGYAGDEVTNGSLAALIDEGVMPDAQRRGISEVSLHHYPEACESQVTAILSGKQPRRVLRRVRRSDGLRVTGMDPYRGCPGGRLLLSDGGWRSRGRLVSYPAHGLADLGPRGGAGHSRWLGCRGGPPHWIGLDRL